MRRCGVAVVCLLVLVGHGVAEEIPELWQFFPFPVLFYTPETGVGGGAAVTVLRTPDGATRPDTINAIGFYTQKNQISLVAESDWQLRGGRQDLKVGLAGSLFPALFYGIGPDTPKGAEESYTPRTFIAELGYGWRIGRTLSVGPLYRLHLTDMDRTESDGALETQTIPGAGGAAMSGAGVEAVWDTRNDVLFPTDGLYVSGRLLGFPGWMGSTDVFYTTRLDARAYREIAPNRIPGPVLAGQTLVEINSGDVPFQAMPSLGGASVLRGYTSGRYIDKTLLAGQAELRVPLFWRLGAAVFGGFAAVAPNTAELLALDTVRVAGGGGLRFGLSRENSLNLRFDLAYGSEGLQFYVSALEAF
jgi:outer membrane protein assembly factor BamA